MTSLAPRPRRRILIREASETSKAVTAPDRFAVFLCPHAWNPSMAWRGGKYPNTHRRSFAVLNLQAAHHRAPLQLQRFKGAPAMAANPVALPPPNA